MSSADGVIEHEEVPSTTVVREGSSDQTSRCNSSSQETIISVEEGIFHLSNGELEKLGSLEKALEGDSSAHPLIQRVPSMLGENKHFQKYFKPKVIAIGPLHHDDPGLQKAEKLKLKLAAYFIKTHGLEKEMLYSKIKMEIDYLKKCYDPKEIEQYYDDDEKLSWMFFVDGCAVLQAIYLRYAPDGEVAQKESKELNIKNDLLTLVYVDLFLLENQIPYRVLDLLTSSSYNHGEQFKESIGRFIDGNVMTRAEMKKEWQQSQQNEKQMKKQQKKQHKGKQQKQEQQKEHPHLLDRLRERLVGKDQKHRDWGYGCLRLIKYILTYNQKDKISHHQHTVRNIKELREAGIWFTPSETSCLKDISFNRICCVGKLHLPPITVDDSTGPKFMNLIAYEMCPDFDNDFTVTSYICFLDSLIDEAEDVRALRDADILHNGMGSDEEVAKLFNKMNTDLVASPIIYSQVKTQIQNHCRNQWITYAAQAYHTHFTSPWTFLAFAGAIAALGLSALQTYYSVIQSNQK
ncbi:hypothetical protein CCACVL1_25555 [Corchorus capsularis]|uniref:Uncharacterized protein n=1 Tax=Corchorus capsularis TaxID=210143 RepID=A0A1R3GJ78_COCAP|nr:hypothetical protein CCACVL1_25555 [Corchorus capsularis]